MKPGILMLLRILPSLIQQAHIKTMPSLHNKVTSQPEGKKYTRDNHEVSSFGIKQSTEDFDFHPPSAIKASPGQLTYPYCSQLQL